MSSFLLVAALAASTTAEGVVAHGWAQGNDDSSRDSVFKAVAGSTVSHTTQLVDLGFYFSFAGVWVSVCGGSVGTVHRHILYYTLPPEITQQQTENSQQHHNCIAVCVCLMFVYIYVVLCPECSPLYHVLCVCVMSIIPIPSVQPPIKYVAFVKTQVMT